MSNTTTNNTDTVSSDVTNYISSVSNWMTNNNTLNYALYNGVGGIPFVTFGMVGIVIGVLAYATFSDAAAEAVETIEDTASAVQSSDMFKNAAGSVEGVGNALETENTFAEGEIMDTAGKGYEGEEGGQNPEGEGEEGGQKMEEPKENENKENPENQRNENEGNDNLDQSRNRRGFEDEDDEEGEEYGERYKQGGSVRSRQSIPYSKKRRMTARRKAMRRLKRTKRHRKYA